MKPLNYESKSQTLRKFVRSTIPPEDKQGQALYVKTLAEVMECDTTLIRQILREFRFQCRPLSLNAYNARHGPELRRDIDHDFARFHALPVLINLYGYGAVKAIIDDDPEPACTFIEFFDVLAEKSGRPLGEIVSEYTDRIIGRDAAVDNICDFFTEGFEAYPTNLEPEHLKWYCISFCELPEIMSAALEKVRASPELMSRAEPVDAGEYIASVEAERAKASRTNKGKGLARAPAATSVEAPHRREIEAL